MNTALAFGAMGLLLAGGAAYAASGDRGKARLAGLYERARWAWRCRPRWRYRGRPPIRAETAPLSRDEIQALGNIAAGRDVRTRT